MFTFQCSLARLYEHKNMRVILLQQLNALWPWLNSDTKTFIVVDVGFENWLISLGEYHRIFLSLSRSVFGRMTHLDQSRARKNIWWITIVDIGPSSLCVSLHFRLAIWMLIFLTNSTSLIVRRSIVSSTLVSWFLWVIEFPFIRVGFSWHWLFLMFSSNFGGKLAYVGRCIAVRRPSDQKIGARWGCKTHEVLRKLKMFLKLWRAHFDLLSKRKPK